MDGKLSYIPKMQSSVSGDFRSIYKTSGAGLLIKLAVFLLMVSLVAFGGSFLLKKVTLSEIEELSLSLAKAKESFDEGTIGEMEILGGSIVSAQKMISGHLFVSNLFQALEQTIIDGVKLNGLNYSYKPSAVVLGGATGVATPGLKITSEGEAENYLAIAQQAEVFKQSKDKIQDFSFSRFSLGEFGQVGFVLDFWISPALLNELPESVVLMDEDE